ncbi:MAG TPA: glycosyltransferase family 4 protein [Acidobacteriota bacterium]|nr:glycosyltransferase family 4 protein [Acidobacteriota bacterium]
MKILSFSHDGSLYGAQRSLIGLLHGLQQRGHDVSLAIPNAGPLADYAREQNINAQVLPYPFLSSKPLRALNFILRYPGAARRIRKLVRKTQPDIVHFNTVACMTPAVALRKSRIPRVWHIRETTVPFIKIVTGLIKHWSDAVIANCRFSAKAYPGLLDLQSTRIVHNGLDLEAPDVSESERVRAEFRWSEGDFVALFAGQLRRHKDPIALVKAVAAARSQGVAVKACIAGDGPVLGDLITEVTRHNLADSIALAGFREDLPALISAADIVVCPSLVEPFPRIGLEAMALGKPMIATHVGGIPEQVVDGETGILIPPGDTAALKQALIELAQNREKCEALGRAAKLRHGMHFSESVYAGGVEEVFRKLLTDQ